MQPTAVIVGGSLAGLRAAETLRRSGHEGPITVIGEEEHAPYDRPPLSKQVLTGKVDAERTALQQEEGVGADWLLGRRATGLDLASRRVTVARRGRAGGVAGNDEEIRYDRLVIATGARPRVLPGFEPGEGVHYLRTLDDSLRLRDDLARAGAVAVIGAGFIGLEVAASAHERGLAVTVLEALPVPLARAIGETAGEQIAAMHRRKGIDVRVGVSIEGLVRGRAVEGIRLSTGELIEADIVVAGIGVAPETSWLEGSGVDISDGVLCDESLRVLAGGRALPDVVAAGDVARWNHPGWGRSARVEHWTNAVEQGEAAARTLMAGDSAEPFSPTPYFWSDQHGLKVQFVGETQPGDDMALIEGSFEEDRFVAAYGRNGRLVAALGMRRPAKVMALQSLIAEGSPFPPS